MYAGIQGSGDECGQACEFVFLGEWGNADRLLARAISQHAVCGGRAVVWLDRRYCRDIALQKVIEKSAISLKNANIFRACGTPRLRREQWGNLSGAIGVTVTTDSNETRTSHACSEDETAGG